MGVLEAPDAAHQLQLHLEGQRGRDAVGVDLGDIQALGLDEHLVAGLVREAHHLVLDRGAVARADPFDLAGVQRAAVQRAADDVVGALAGVGDPAVDLARVVVAAAQEGEHRPRIVPGLALEHCVVKAAAVDARRRAGLEPVDLERPFAQLPGQGVGGWLAGAAGGMRGLPDVHLAGQEGAGGQHHGRCVEAQAGLGQHAGDPPGFKEQVVDASLEHGQSGLGLDGAADEAAVEVAVGLAAGGAHRRPLAGVEPPPLDAGRVRGARHHPAQRVDLAHQVALADAADGGIAAHRADGFDGVGEQQRSCAGAGGGERGFGAGMAATDHDHVMAEEVVHGPRDSTFDAPARWCR